MAGFFLLFETTLCEWAQTCLNPLLKVLSVSCLILGIVLVFVGFVIVIYTKRDDNTQVIISKGKRLNKSNLDSIEKHQQQIQNLLDVDHHKSTSKSNSNAMLSSKIEIKIDLDEPTTNHEQNEENSNNNSQN